MTERYDIYGGLGSPYSMKMRAILRYRRLPHVWHQMRKDSPPIFANVKAVKAELKGPEVLEISMDTKAKVNEGDYARGGKNPDRRGWQGREGLGS